MKHGELENYKFLPSQEEEIGMLIKEYLNLKEIALLYILNVISKVNGCLFARIMNLYHKLIGTTR